MGLSDSGRYPWWTAAAFCITAVLLTPYIPLAGSLFSGGGESWDHVRDTVLLRYIGNTVILVGLSVLFATSLGVAGAWILERYEIPGRRILEILVVAPLALPVYISTFTWGGILGFGGPVSRLVGRIIPFSGWPAAVFILSTGLYPYVYLTVRGALMGNSRVLFEVVAALSGATASRVSPLGAQPSQESYRLRDIRGMSSARVGLGVLLVGVVDRLHYWRRLRRGVFPSLRPAIVGGASLVAMEVMNSYATPVYLGVETLSTGVFRTWFGLGDLETATTLAAFVLLSMLGLIVAEQYLRGRRRYTAAAGALPRRKFVGPLKRVVFVVILVIPPTAGFVLPTLQLGWWSILGIGGAGVDGILTSTARTVALAAGATLMMLIVALLLNFAAYLRPGRATEAMLHGARIGYAVPGTVVAIGVLAVFRSLSAVSDRLFLFGSVAGLFFAYTARYLAVAMQPLHAAFARHHRSTVDAARSLGRRPADVLARVVLPVFRPTLAGAALIVAIDVIKDLPMTLLLRPFDFNTLAVEVYRLASDERLPEAAPRALLLVAVGIFTIGLIMRPVRRRSKGASAQ